MRNLICQTVVNDEVLFFLEEKQKEDSQYSNLDELIEDFKESMFEKLEAFINDIDWDENYLKRKIAKLINDS